MARVTLKKDGTIEFKQGAFAPRSIGRWEHEDVWKQNGGRRDKSGNLLVRHIYRAKLHNGLELTEYSRDGLVKAIRKCY